MGKRGGRKGRNKPTRVSGGDPFYGRAVREAGSRGLWILSDGKPGDPKWTVFSRSSGVHLLTYRPKSGRWWGGGTSGTASTYSEALAVADSILHR